MIDDDSLLSELQVCEFLQVTTSHFKRMVKKGIFPEALYTGREKRWVYAQLKPFVVGNDPTDKPPTMDPTKIRLLDLDDLCRWIGVERGKIKRWIRNGEFPKPLCLAGEDRWRMDAINEWVKKAKMSERFGVSKPLPALPFLLPKQIEDLAEHLRELDVRVQCCVYFLVKGSQVVYVGSSTCLAKRIYGHKDKDFDRVFYLLVEADRMLDVEADFIRIFQPLYNIAGTLKTKPLPEPSMNGGAAETSGGFEVN